MKLPREKNCWQKDMTWKDNIIGLCVGLTVSVTTGILFYRSIVGIIITLPLSIYFYRQHKRNCLKKYEVAFREQFKEALSHLLAALSVGYSIENAVIEAYKDLLLVYKKEDRICREFAYMVNQLKMNCAARQVLGQFDQRVSQEDLHNFVTVFAVSKQSGGNLIYILKKAGNQICAKIETANEIQNMLSAKQMEFKVMAAVPFGILIYMQFGFGEVMNLMYGNMVGYIVMTGCLLAYAGAYHLGRIIVEIQV